MKKGQLIKCIFSKEGSHMFSILIKIKGRAKEDFLLFFQGLYIIQILSGGGAVAAVENNKGAKEKIEEGEGKRSKIASKKG